MVGPPAFPFPLKKEEVVVVAVVIIIIKRSFFRCILELGKREEQSRVGSEMHPSH